MNQEQLQCNNFGVIGDSERNKNVSVMYKDFSLIRGLSYLRVLKPWLLITMAS